MKLGDKKNLKCLDNVLSQLRIGDWVRVKCPSSSAYGQIGGNGVPPGSDIRLQVEVIGCD